MNPLALYIVFAMLATIWLDAASFRIPNWLNGSLMLLYPVAVLTSHAQVDWMMAVCGMLIVFGLGYMVFSFNIMGAGDIKLLTACALWIGWGNLLEFILIVAVLGGALSLFLLIIRKFDTFIPVKEGRQLPRLLRHGEPVPYGLAIAATMLLFLAQARIPALT